MRRAAAAAALVVSLGLAVSACGGGGKSVNSTPDSTTAAPAATSSTPDAKATATATASATPTKAAPAAIGQTITLHGQDPSTKLAVTMVKWVDPAKGADEYTVPDSGKRFVAVQVSILNTGTGVYDDSPTNGLQIADAQSQRFDPDYDEVSAGPSMATEIKLSPGDKALGYVSFQVPRTSKVTTIQFTADSGFADETGQWTVG